MSSDFTRPEREFRVGAVRVTVWANPRYGTDGKTWTSHRVAMDCGYKDHDGNWRKKADTLTTQEIPQAILALKRAYEYLTMNKTEKEEGITEPAAASPVPARIP